TKPTSQYCSRPSRQLAQVRQESTMQPTAASSPGLKFFTWFPTAVTRPTISCPGTQGYVVFVHSLRAVCRSEWQTPQKRISIWMSRGPGSRRSNENGASGDFAELAAYPMVLMVAGAATVDLLKGVSFYES